MLYTQPKGRTALYDALYLGVNEMKKAKHQRKALLVISDGGDNRSRYTDSEVKSVIKEADVLIYSIGIFDQQFSTREERLGPNVLNDISEITGAQCYTLDNPNDLPMITQHIGNKLRHQYVLAYRPNNLQGDGKWRKIKVKLTLLPREMSQLDVHAKTGYYTPSR